MTELKEGCVKPARGPIVPPEASEAATPTSSQEVRQMSARVGQVAPDFESNAFIAGKGFTPIRLLDYRSKWVVLCFYPGDFTFV